MDIKSQEGNNEHNNLDELNKILDNIFSGLTGDSKEDFNYLNKKSEEYKNHPLSKEINREIGRKIYDLLSVDDKKDLQKIINDEMEKSQEKFKEVKELINGKNRDLGKAKELLFSVIDNSLTFESDSKTEYYYFVDIIDFLIFSKIHKSEKEIKWISTPLVTAYAYLAFIYNEEGNYDEAVKMIDKAIRWSPMDLDAYFEKSETYKMQKKWDEYKKITDSLYDKIYKASDLARYYRNLGYYYIETNNLNLAYALYTLSLIFEENSRAHEEMMYINKQLNRNGYDMPIEECQSILQSNNIQFGPNPDNIRRMIDLYETEKDLLKNPEVEMQLASRIYFLTFEKKFAPLLEYVDKDTMCLLRIPRTWRSFKEEHRKEKFGQRNMFAFFTDYGALFQANYDGKCSMDKFEEIYKLNINNMVNHNELKMKLLDEGSLILLLKQGKKEFKYAVFDMNHENKTIRSIHYFTIINGIFADFSINLDEKIDYKNLDIFNNQRAIRDVVTILSNLIELKAPEVPTKN